MKKIGVLVILGACAISTIWYVRRRRIDREIDEFDRLMREWKTAQTASNHTENCDILNA